MAPMGNSCAVGQHGNVIARGVTNSFSINVLSDLSPWHSIQDEVVGADLATIVVIIGDSNDDSYPSTDMVMETDRSHQYQCSWLASPWLQGCHLPPVTNREERTVSVLACLAKKSKDSRFNHGHIPSRQVLEPCSWECSKSRSSY